MNLYISPRNIAGTASIRGTAGPSISVPVFAFSDVLENSAVNNSGLLLKIDCEGCEQALLSTLSREIAERISCIIFEPEHNLYSLDDLLQGLRELGYETSRVSNLVVAERTA